MFISKKLFNRDRCVVVVLYSTYESKGAEAFAQVFHFHFPGLIWKNRSKKISFLFGIMEYCFGEPINAFSEPHRNQVC